MKAKETIPKVVYNTEYNFPAQRSDLIKIEPNQLYHIVVTWENDLGLSEITPTITLPSNKGKILSANHANSPMLSTCNTSGNPTCEIEYMSELGYIDVSFHCKITDHRNVPYWGSSKILRKTAMKTIAISNTKKRYFCTDNTSENFNCYVFTIEWIKKEPS